MHPKFLIVGFGSAGERALALLRALRPSSEFLVVSRHATAGVDIPVVKSLEAGADFAPDAIILTGPSTTRAEVLRHLRALDVPVFIEKPLATSLGEGLAVVELLGGPHRRAQLGYNLRFSESLNNFRELVRGGRYGRVTRFTAETAQYLPDWRPGRDFRETVSARAELGGGVLLELSHELDYIRWIFGEWEWVSAWTGQTSSLALDVEDTALVTIGVESEKESVQLVGHLALDFARRDKTRTVTALCENGTVRWDGISGSVELYEPSNSQWSALTTDSGSEFTYDAQWESFLSLVEENSEPAVSVADGVEVLRIVEAIRQSSSQLGARVYVQNIGVGL